MDYSVRPYTKVVVLPKDVGLGRIGGHNKDASAIPLTDSGGNALLCNWIRVSPTSGIAGGVYGVFFSSMDDITLPMNNVSGTDASAMPGMTGSIDPNRPDTLEIVLSDSDAVSEIQLGVARLDGAGGGSFAITYGYRMPINPMRALGANRGS